MKSSHKNGAIGLLSTLCVAIVAGLYIKGCILPPPPPPPPPPPDSCEKIVSDMWTLWGFERDFAYRHKHLATSISEMGDGVGIGKDGFILSPSIWKARLDADNNNIQHPSYGAYRFGIIPALSGAGEIDPFSAIIIVLPEKPAKDDSCFVALCGPVNLQNDFSFDKEWPVYRVNAEDVIVRELRERQPISIDTIKQRLTNGDLKGYVKKSFSGFNYPKDAE